MRDRVGGYSNADLHLLERFLVSQNNLRDYFRRSAVEAIAHRFHRSKVLGHEFHKTLVVQMAGRSDNHVSRRKALPIEIEDGRALETLDCVASPENRSAEWMVLPEVLGENFMYEVVRIVLVHLDFFQDHAAFACDVLIIKNRIQNQVAEDVKSDRQMLVQHFHAETDAFLGGERV